MVMISAWAMASRVCGSGSTLGGTEEQFLDAAFAGGDFGFAANPGAVFHQRFEFDVGSGGGIDVSASDQNFGRKAHGFGEILSDGSERREKKIAEAVAFKARAFFEAMAEKLGEQGFIFAEGDDAVADVAGRKHVEFFAQASAGAAVVADGDDGAEIANDGASRGTAPNSPGARAKRFSPLSRVERPVPPPMATTRRPRSRVVFSSDNETQRFWFPSRESRCIRLTRFFFTEGAFRRRQGRQPGIRIQQFGEARILGQIVEVGIVARLEAQAGIQAKRLVQMLQGILHMTGQAIERGQA